LHIENTLIMKNNTLFFFILFFPLLIQAQDQFHIFFDFNLDELNETSLSRINDWVKQNEESEVLKIYGFSDEIGSIEYNDDLSLKRAESVYRNFKHNSIKIADNIEIKAFGKLFNLSENQNENRKVIVFFEKSKKHLLAPSEINVIREIKRPVLHQILVDKNTKMIKVGNRLNIDKLNFYLDSYIFSAESKESLDELLDFMKTNRNIHIEIQGHNCCLPFDINDLSTKRARTVYTFLKSNGIKKKRLSYKGYGTTRPIFSIPEKNEEERSGNRRVDIQILKK
jgi:outer membrane protein OmpA-like peptidoglycan-associated protein